MKRNISSNAVALLLISLMLLSSFAFLSSNVTYGQENITFTSGVTMDFTSTQTMTFRPDDISMKFGTGIRMQFQEVAPDGMLAACDLIQVVQPPGYTPPECSWWEVFDPLTGKALGEIHIDGAGGPGEVHIDYVYPGPFSLPAGMLIWAEMKLPKVEPCETYVVHEPAHWWPWPCTWWMIIDPETREPSGFDFHVDWTNESCEFHPDIVLPEPYILGFPVYELEARLEMIDEIHPCDWFIITDPQGYTPESCSWWEILDPSGEPTGLEFHVDQSGGGRFHVDDVIPLPYIKLPWGPSTSITVRKKIDIIQQCSWFKVTDPANTPGYCSWWRVIHPDVGDVEFHVDESDPDGTFHVDFSTQSITFLPQVYMVTAERKIDDIIPCDWFLLSQGSLPEKCSWWRIISPQEWAGIIFHVDSNDGASKFHVDEVQGQLPPIEIPPWQVIAEPYQTPQPPSSWYIKPPYPDYAISGMPDFDERQDNWYWRYWAYPDAVAVWQHNDTVDGGQHGGWDWEIYYSIYTDPDMWWTLGTDNTRAIVQDSLTPGPARFLLGDDMEPAISWYSSNYAICVWQHYNVYYSDWDIWYSLFTPNVGWTWPAPVWQAMGKDLDPVIAFDTNGYAICVWRHQVDPQYWLAYSIWDPTTMTWGNQGWVYAPAAPTPCLMPEVCVDSNHNIVVIWTDPTGTGAGTEKVWYSWATFNTPIPPAPVWSPGAIVTNSPQGVNWQKGISPDTLGNVLIDFGLPAAIGPAPGQEPLYYAEFVSPNWVTPSTQLPGPTNGEHPDLAYDFNNNAIAVYTNWAQAGPTGQLWYAFWNGANWQPNGGAFAATANAVMDQWPAITFIKNNKAVVVWQAYPEPNTVSEIYYSVYTPTYPTDSWTQANKIYEPNNPALFLTGDDYYVDIASPTGSATTPMSIPPEPPEPANPYWTWCGPLAVANSIWWFDSKYESGTTPPPEKSDHYSLVTSYNPGVWDDHDPQNVKPFVEHLAYLMDCDGMRTRTCHDGTTVWDMQAGITHYLSWSGVNPLGDVNGDGIVDETDLTLVSNAMGSRPGDSNWNLAADIYPVTTAYPPVADNIVDVMDMVLVVAHMGEKGQFYEHTTDLYPHFSYIEEEVMRCQDVVLCLGFYQDGIRDGGHFVTVAGVNSTTLQLLISNPIRDDYEAGITPGRSPVAHPYPHDGTVHNNASLVSQDAWTVRYNAAGGYWYLEGYFSDSTWEARIEFAVITSPFGVHDIKVKDVSPFKTVVGQNCTCSINVTVLNEGDFTETFDLTLYAFTMPPEAPIETRTVSNLLSKEERVITFIWNTTGWSKGNYTIKAVADTVPGETDTADNSKVDGWVVVTIPGDANGDGKVGTVDLSMLGQAWDTSQADPNNELLGTVWNANCDFNDDKKIGTSDLSTMGKYWGKIDP